MDLVTVTVFGCFSLTSKCKTTGGTLLWKFGFEDGQIYIGKLVVAEVSGLEGEEELLTIVPATVRSPFTGS